jgi:hypothetical protein
MALTLRERVEKRFAGLKNVRLPYEAEWKEIAQHAQPSRGRFLYDDKPDRRNGRSNRAIYNSHGILAFRILASGMTSGLSSPSRPWFRLATYDEQQMDDADTRIYLSDVERIMYGFLAETNFYAAAKAGYAELGMFGTEACVMVEHPVRGAVCHSLTVGEYWIALGNDGTPDTLYRKADMSVHQCVQSFGLDKVSQRVRDFYDDSRYDEIVQVRHAIEPNDEQDAELKTAKGKPWRSFYWDEQDGDRQNGSLRIQGFEEQSFWAPRWDAIGGDTYGSSPGMEALPDLRELQLQTKRKTEATAFLVKPEKVVPSTLKITGQAGNVVSVGSVDKDMVIVPYQMPYQAIEAILADIERCTNAVDRLAYADVFLAITQMEGSADRTVPEINARLEEKMTQLGPVIERVNNEKLSVVIDRTFGIMSRLGMLPPAPEALQGAALKIDFVSILTQMQRAVGLSQTERTTSYIGTLAAAFPEAADKLNVDEAIDDYADRAGSPPKIIRSDDDVEAIREQRARQQAAQAAAAAMPAAKDGADAARLLAEATQTGGGIQQLLGQGL